MTTRFCAALGVACAVAAGSGLYGQAPPQSLQGQTTPQQPPPVFRSAVDLVAVDVSVVDRTGRPMRGLETSDFQLTVDGQRRQISSVQFISQEMRPAAPALPEPQVARFSSNDGVTGGRLVLILIDRGTMQATSGRMYLKTVDRFLSRLGPGDRSAFAVMPGGIEVNFTRFHSLVRNAVGNVMGGPDVFGRTMRVGLAEGLAIERREPNVFGEVADRECSGGFDADQRAQCVEGIQAEARNVVANARTQARVSLTSLRSLLHRLAKIEGSKTVVLLSEGLPIDRDLDMISWVSQDAAEARVTLHALRIIPAMFDASDDRIKHSGFSDQDIAGRGLDMLVGLARGTMVSVLGSSEHALDSLAMEMSGFYLVGFEPEVSDRDGKPHKIDVKVVRPGVTVRSRTHFVAPPVRATRPSDQELIMATLRDPLLASEVPLKTATYCFKDPGSEQLKVIVTAQLGSTASPTEPRSVGFVVTDDKGNERGLTVEPAPAGRARYLGAALVPAGVYTLKLAVVDDQGRRGSVEHRFDAKLSTGGPFRFGDLMLAEGNPGSALRPMIEPKVSRGSVVGYTELYTTDPERFDSASVSFEVAREPNDPALARAAGSIGETLFPARRLAQGQVPVASLPSGEYVLRAVVSVGGRPVARLLRSFTLLSGGATSP